MQLQVLGVGNAFSARRYNTSFLIRSHRLYLVDGPQALFRILWEREVEPEEIDAVVVTHVHGDHTSGLETLLLWKRYVQKHRLDLYTSRRVYKELEERFFPRFQETFSDDYTQIVSTRLEDYANFVELKENVPNPLDGELAVEIRHNWHPTPTLGLKFISGEGSIGIGGDTCYRPSLLDRLLELGQLDRARYEKLAGTWLWESDLIYHEANRREPTPHTLERDLLALPPQVRRKVRLVHLPDDFEEGPLPLARQGETVTFPEKGVPRIELPPT